MFDLRLHRQIRRARLGLEDVERSQEDAMNAADDEEKRYEAWSYWSQYIDMCEENYRLLLTKYWTKRARDKFVSRPAMNRKGGYWEQTSFGNRWVLTDKGIFHLRAGIRQETSLSNENYFKWAAVVLGLLAVAVRFIP